jgi:SH3-like domain-containing protein
MSVAVLAFRLHLAALGMLLAVTPAWGQRASTPPVVHAQGSTHAVKPPPSSDPFPIPLPLPPPPAPRPPPLSAARPPATSAKPETGKPGPTTQAKPPPPPQDPNKGSNSGLPIPRFVSLRSAEVNLRSGPGERYQIDWVYQRRDLPVEIEREFDIWRLIRDADGVRGWVQEVMVMGRRSFEVTGADRTLRSDADDTSRAVAILKVGVVGRLRACAAKADWCQVQVGDYRGWLRRDEFWGTLPGEPVGN